MPHFQENFPDPSTLTVPELEIRYDALEGYRSGATRKPRPLMNTCVDLLEIYQQGPIPSSTDEDRRQGVPHVVYKRNLGHEALVDHFLSPGDENIMDELERGQHDDNLVRPTISTRPRLRIIFVKGYILPNSSTYSHRYAGDPLAEIGWIPKTIHYNDVYAAIHPQTAQFLTSQLGVSPAFWAVLLSKTWILKTGNCVLRKRGRRSESVGVDGDSGTDPSAVEGWYRYSCGLRGYPSHVWFSYTSDTTTYILNNAIPNGIEQSILHCVYAKKLGQMMLAPLVVDGFVAEAASEAWGKEVLRPRLTLVQYERMDGRKAGNDPSESIRDLHILSYNLLIIKEDMIDHIERLQFLIDLHKTLHSLYPCTPSLPSPSIPEQPQQLAATGARKVDVSDTFSFLLSETQIRKRWVQNYADRTAIQINLYYSLAAQRDNQTNLDIAKFTGRIAKETQRDSSSMITMAAVTMLFLPGTFVSAIFSMVFFDSDKDSSSGIGLSLHRSAWLFPVITIPLTVLVFLAWNLWRIQRNKKHVPQGDSLLEKGDAGSSSIVGSAIWFPQRRRGGSSPRSGPNVVYVHQGSSDSPGARGAIPVGSTDSLSYPSSPLQTPVPLPPGTMPCPDSLPVSSQADTPPHEPTKQEVPTIPDLRDFQPVSQGGIHSVSSLPLDDLEAARPSNSPHDTVNADTPALGFDEDGHSISKYGRGTPAWWTRIPPGAQTGVYQTGLSGPVMLLEDLYPPTAGAIPSETRTSFAPYGPQPMDGPPSRGLSEHSSVYPSDLSLPELRSGSLTPAEGDFDDDESNVPTSLRNATMAHTVIVPEPLQCNATDGADILGYNPSVVQPESEQRKDWEDG